MEPKVTFLLYKFLNALEQQQNEELSFSFGIYKWYFISISCRFTLKQKFLADFIFENMIGEICFDFNWGGIKPRWTPDKEVRSNP